VTKSVLVVGGGISGLVTAHEILKNAPETTLELLESGDTLGGNMGTEEVDGFVFERGPNGFQDSVPDTVDLASELGLRERLLGSSPLARRRYLLKRGRLYPLSPKTLFFSSLLSVTGRLRLLTEPLRRRGTGEEESVAAFGRRRLGAEATASLLDPVVTGVYAGDLERLSLRQAFPRVAAMEDEHGSLFRGVLKAAKVPRTLYSFPRGLAELADALQARLEPNIRLETPVTKVSWPNASQGTELEVTLRDGERCAAKSVVCATPAPRAAHLFSGENSTLARALEAMPYAPVAVLCLGYRREDVKHPLDGFGFLVPRSEGLRSLGAIWVSSIYPDHAPAGTVSLRVLFGGAHDPEAVGAPADELRSIFERELGAALRLGGEPLVSRVYRYTLGIPQYNLGHSERLQRTATALRDYPGVFLVGNAYRGVGINDCVRESARMADAVRAFLRRNP
jgi:oxygen-dependent protoporphyrinogen oxidase